MNFSLMNCSFCPSGSWIWDVTQIWHSDPPCFSPCFRKAAPILISSAFLLLCLPFEWASLYSRASRQKSNSRNPIPLNRNNLARLGACCTIIVTAAVQLLLDLNFQQWQENLIIVNYFYSVGSILIFIILAILINCHRKRGHYTSGRLWTFSLIYLICQLPSLYMATWFRSNNNCNFEEITEFDQKWWEPTIFFTQFTAIFILFLVSSTADGIQSNPSLDDGNLEKNNKDFSKLQEDPSRESLLDRQQPLLAPELESPESRASFLSILTFHWFTPLLVKGQRGQISLADLWRLAPEDTTEEIGARFGRNLLAASSTTDKKSHSDGYVDVQRALWRSFGWRFVFDTAIKITADGIQFSWPFLLKAFIDFIETPTDPQWHGYMYVALFFALSSAYTIALAAYFYRMYHMGVQMNTGLIAAIYRKSLRLSPSASISPKSEASSTTPGTSSGTTLGEIVNLMSVDAARYSEQLPYLSMIALGPARITLMTYFIWREIGWSVFVGIGCALLALSINWFFNAHRQVLLLKQMKEKDDRIRAVGEMLSGMRTVKLNAWEPAFGARIEAIREREILKLREISWTNAINAVIWSCTPFLVSTLTFVVYVLSGPDHVLDAKKIFVSLALFNQMHFPLSMLPRVISGIVTWSSSRSRLNDYLNAPELTNYLTRKSMPSQHAISIHNGGFCWSKSGLEGFRLQNINLSIPKGALAAIVGPVGAGKSSLLAAMLGSLERSSGFVTHSADSTTALVVQQAWILNATLRENILFGLPYKKAKYEQILRACALEPDVAALPGGSDTEIGENGVNLSGGQKQRVALARACYSGASIVLLDDPLAAVDASVSQHIFQQVLSSKSGYLRSRTRILVTHDTSLLPEVDQVIMLLSGTIVESGSYQELINKKGSALAAFCSQNIRILPNSKQSKKAKSKPEVAQKKIPLIGARQLTEKEHTETGRVKAQVYRNLFRSITYRWLAIILAGYIGIQAFSVASNVWLAIWSNDNSIFFNLPGNRLHHVFENITSLNGTDSLIQLEHHRNYHLLIFCLLSLGFVLFVVIGAIAKEMAMMRSSVTLHRALLQAIIHSPMAFFERTPLGRTLNRFSNDIDAIDTKIPYCIHMWLIMVLSVLATVVLISVQVPSFIPVLGPLVFLYYYIQKFYISTSRQLKRLEAVTRSPIYSHFSETLAGAPTIRAYGAGERFTQESARRLDLNNCCKMSSVVANRWLAVRLEFCGNLVVFFTVFLAALARDTFLQYPGFVGLIITYALNITQCLNMLVRYTAELETNVIAVERINEYAHNEPEAEWTRAENLEPTIPEAWPQAGEIRVIDYSVRYRPDLNLALRHLNFIVKPGEKLGIVGRTGSGKSTLALALFRLLEPTTGRIEIDGLDCSQIGLHELRAKLSIIPQDPVLFSGTIRSNLDPTEAHSDAQLWRVLDECHLRSHISSLDAQIMEAGQNLSVGQRQLLCLSRVLLRESRILVLDEATAAVDPQTDALLQETIRRRFANCTVLCIAHRLQTVLSLDRVLVMSDGRVVELDTPEALLSDPGSRLHALAKSAGLI